MSLKLTWDDLLIQCYAFAPHPALLGRIDIGHVMVMDIGVWQQICAQLFISKQDQ